MKRLRFRKLMARPDSSVITYQLKVGPLHFWLDPCCIGDAPWESPDWDLVFNGDVLLEGVTKAEAREYIEGFLDGLAEAIAKVRK